jgi:ketosteroid isomerase-like protein
MTPTEVAQAYLAAVDGHDGLALADLFADDGEFHVGDVHLRGRDAILQHFAEETFQRQEFWHEQLHELANANMVALVMEAHLGDARFDILDLFTIVDGRIASLNVYQGPNVG